MNRIDAEIILLEIKNEYIEKKDSKIALALTLAIKDMVAMDKIVNAVDERYDY